MNRTIIVVVLLVILLGGFALVQSQKKVTQTAPATTNMTPSSAMKEQPTTTAVSPASSEGTTTSEGGVKEFTVEGKNFSFTPSTITVNKGDKVSITFKNAGGTHDFVLDQYNVKTKPIEAGASETVTFTADKTGTFDYYCSVANHRAMGMQGKLTVK